jgi:O-antigen/teichoic acid export membrane protein
MIGRLAWNSLTNYVTSGVMLAVGFLLTPILIRALGDAGYGVWVLVGSLASYFWLLDFGLGSSVTRFVSQLDATGDRDELNRVVASSCALLAIGGGLALLGSLLLAAWADTLFKVPPESAPALRTMIVISGLSLCLSFPLGVFGGVLRGYQRYDLLNAAVIVTTLLNAAGSLLALRLGWGLIGLSVISLVTSLLTGSAGVLLTLRVDPLMRPRLEHVRLTSLRRIVSFSVWVLVINVAVQVVYRTSPIIIAVVLGVASVTPFAIASSLMQYVRRLVDPVLSVLLPVYAGLSAVDETERVRQLFVEGSRVVSVIAVPVLLALVLLAKPLIALWIGPGYEQSGDLLYVLVPTLYLSFLIGSGDKLLWAKGKVRVNSSVAVVDTLLNLTLSVVLVSNYGVLGAAWAMLISVGLTNGLWLMPYICREAGVPIGSYARRVLAPVLLPALPSAAVVLWLMSLAPIESYMQVVLLAAACATSYWAVFVVISGQREWRRWWTVLQSLRPTLRRKAVAT